MIKFGNIICKRNICKGKGNLLPSHASFPSVRSFVIPILMLLSSSSSSNILSVNGQELNKVFKSQTISGIVIRDVGNGNTSGETMDSFEVDEEEACEIQSMKVFVDLTHSTIVNDLTMDLTWQQDNSGTIFGQPG